MDFEVRVGLVGLVGLGLGIGLGMGLGLAVPIKTFEDCPTVCPAIGDYCWTIVGNIVLCFE